MPFRRIAEAPLPEECREIGVGQRDVIVRDAEAHCAAVQRFEKVRESRGEADLVRQRIRERRPAQVVKPDAEPPETSTV